MSGTDLSKPRFPSKRPRASAPPWLITENYEDEVIGPLKGGKEAMMILVKRRCGNEHNLLARKKYRPVATRSFKRNEIYLEGMDAAFRNSRRKWGNEPGSWEFEALHRLWHAGLQVPYPVDLWSGLLMEYVGDEDRAAPQLARASSDRPGRVLDQILANIYAATALGIVHADLSVFNILYWHGKITIIDFGQSVLIGHNPHALPLLYRDVSTVISWFNKRLNYKHDSEEEFQRLVDSVL